MKTLKQLIESKGPHAKLVFVSPEQTVLEALKIMAEYDVGALLVMDGPRLTGMFSERDYARKVDLHGKSSRHTTVSEVMTGKVLYATQSNMTIEECMALMTEKHFRHLPILDAENKVVGVVSIRDVVKEMVDQQQFIIGQLESYITR